jgi:hypothetical protein
MVGVTQIERIEASVQQPQRTLKEENRRLVGEVERMKKTEERLEKDNIRLRGNRRKFKDEEKIAVLEARGLIDESEIKRLQERYREVTDQKVALAEQLAVSSSTRTRSSD